MDLTGLIDPHVHAAPEHIPRLLDGISIARQALNANMGGVLIKSHTALTADRASAIADLMPEIRIWGGLVLNKAVGGFSPKMVESAISHGAAEIWLPTIDAENHNRFHGKTDGGLTILKDGYVSDEVHEIMQLIADRHVILGTGHLSVVEICKAVHIAQEHGVEKILITHPEAPFVSMPICVQRDLACLGCRFERTWVFTTQALGRIMTPERIINEIRSVGIESTVLATDMGQIGNPPPVEGYHAYVQSLVESGFAESEIRQMGARNIREWLS